MKLFTKILVLTVLTGLLSCESTSVVDDDDNGIHSHTSGPDEICDCEKKYVINNSNEMPEVGEVYLRINNRAQETKLKVYKGSLERGELIKEIITQETRNTIVLPVNTKYTFVAEYLKDDDTIKVPVSTTFECEYQSCSNGGCYDFHNNVVDLRLKFLD